VNNERFSLINNGHSDSTKIIIKEYETRITELETLLREKDEELEKTIS